MNLKEIADLAWSKIYPAGSKAPIPRESFVRSAYANFAYQSLLMAWKEKADEGYYEVPSYLLTEIEKDIVNDEMDISDLKYFKSLPMEVWLVRIGEWNCKCKYVKSTANLAQLLCEDDSLDDEAKTYFPLGAKIKFPKGTHTTPLRITYANMGEDLNGNIEVSEAIGSLVLSYLDTFYLGKVPPVDVTNNANPNV